MGRSEPPFRPDRPESSGRVVSRQAAKQGTLERKPTAAPLISAKWGRQSPGRQAVAQAGRANEVTSTVSEVDSQDTGNTAAVSPEITNPDDSADSESDGDTDMLVYNDITCPSDTESSDLVERLKRSRFARRVRNVVVSITQKARATGSKDDSKEIDGEGKAQTGSTTDAVAVVSHAIATSVEEVHWPSAALGAVASAVGILLICTVTGRR